MSKLVSVKKIRHYWISFNKKCDCGCKKRVLVNRSWICFEKLREELEDQGYVVNPVRKGTIKNFLRDKG